jgi:hypothetical protein
LTGRLSTFISFRRHYPDQVAGIISALCGGTPNDGAKIGIYFTFVHYENQTYRGSIGLIAVIGFCLLARNPGRIGDEMGCHGHLFTLEIIFM